MSISASVPTSPRPRKFLRLIKTKEYAEALQVAEEQIEHGAQMIDINMDEGMLDSQAEMTHFLHLCAMEPNITRVPIVLDFFTLGCVGSRPEMHTR